MNNLEIEKGLRGALGKEARFLGVLLADEVERLFKTRQPVVCIINTLPSWSQKKMGHWLCIYRDPNRVVCLDSYAQEPRSYSVYFKNLEKPGLQLIRNTFRLQQMHSDVCGAYAMYFTYYITHIGPSDTLKRVCSDFSKADYSGNDEFVMLFAYNKFSMPPCPYTFNTCP